MIRRFKLGRDVELHKRTLESGLLSLDRPRRAARRRRADLPEPEHAHRGAPDRRRRRAADRDRRRRRRALRRRGRRARRRRADRRGRRARGRGGGRDPPRRDRPPALRLRPRRHGDPAGGRPQRARRLVREGLLRRPGDRRAAALPRQAEPPPARAAAVRPGRAPARRCGSASGRSARSGTVVESPRFGADRARARAARGRARRHGRGRRRRRHAPRSSSFRSQRRNLRAATSPRGVPHGCARARRRHRHRRLGRPAGRPAGTRRPSVGPGRLHPASCPPPRSRDRAALAGARGGARRAGATRG